VQPAIPFALTMSSSSCPDSLGTVDNMISEKKQNGSRRKRNRSKASLNDVNGCQVSVAEGCSSKSMQASVSFPSVSNW